MLSKCLKWLGCVLALVCMPGLALATLVRFDTPKGPIDIQLYDADTPKTVANFLSYVRSTAYDNTFFHRHAIGFVLQGGGYTFPPVTAVVKLPPVQNEFSVTRSNLRGTVAMAKTAVSPDSATSEWFVNLANNAANLDNQNGGFTVFGRVTTPGMVVVDAITALPVVNAGSPFDNLPVLSRPPAGANLQKENLVMVAFAKELATTTASATERVLNYLEAAYPQYARPASPPLLDGLGYRYRYYEKTNAYVGTKDGNVYYLVPAISPDITLLGPLADWLATAAANGY